MLEVAGRFCTNAQRATLFRGLLAYRAALSGIGLNVGIQWLNGSFCEDIEKTRGRPPGDIDVVTFILRPAHLVDPANWTAFFNANLPLLDPRLIKLQYQCDAMLVDVARGPGSVIPQTAYWFGLFTHQRTTFLWKGIVQVGLGTNDADADALVNGLHFAP